MIINADDFGTSPEVTSAILECFRRGLCSSTTLLPNAPATDQASELARERKLADHIGLHMCLDDAEPLTEAIRAHPRFCDDEGRLAFSRAQPTFRLDAPERAALAAEIRAQIARCRALGLPLTHLDSHHHVHTEWAIGAVVVRIAREEGVPWVRLARNCGPGIPPLKRAYKAAFNARIRARGLARTRLFGSLRDLAFVTSNAAARASSFEAMVHPVRGEAGRILDGNEGPDLELSLRDIEGSGLSESFGGRRYQSSET